MNDLVHIEAEVRNLGLRYKVMAGMALWVKIVQFGVKWHIMVQYIFHWRDVRNSGHISACITILDQFRRFRAGLITLRSICQVCVNCPEMVHNDTICPVAARYVHLWPHLTQRSSFWSILRNWVLIGYVCLMTPDSCRCCMIWHLMVPYDLL